MYKGERAVHLLVVVAFFCFAFASFVPEESMALSGDPVKAEREEVAKVVDEFRQGWSDLSVKSLLKGFDKDYEHLIYLPTELEKPLTTWKDLEKYFEDGVAFFLNMNFVLKGLTIDVFGDTAFAFSGYDFNFQAKGSPDMVNLQGYVTFILRKKQGHWRIIHYHESVPSTSSET